MNFLTNNWYRIGAIIGAIIVIYIFIGSIKLPYTQFILLLNLLALFTHQFEEYQLPGGAPIIINKVVYNESTLANKYPGNAISIMIVNVTAWIIYALAIFLPKIYWLGLGIILFSLFQILGHCVQMPIKLHTWYNPGMLTTILLFLPLGIIYIKHLSRLNELNYKTWIFAFFILIICILLSIVVPVQLLKNKNTKYPISKWQIKKYNKIIKNCNFKEI